MSLAELQTLACDSTGNVVNMETLEERGTSGGVTLIELPCPQAAESSGVYHRPGLYCSAVLQAAPRGRTARLHCRAVLQGCTAGLYTGLCRGAVPGGCTGC